MKIIAKLTAEGETYTESRNAIYSVSSKLLQLFGEKIAQISPIKENDRSSGCHVFFIIEEEAL